MNESTLKHGLGQRIKKLRIQKGLTQGELAEKIGVGERNLSKIECGEIFVKSSTLSNIISSLQIEPKELFDFSGERKESEIKAELIDAITQDKIDVQLLYKIYRSIKY